MVLPKLSRYRAFTLVPAAVLGYSATYAQGVLVSPDAVNQPVPTAQQAASTRIGSISAPPLRQPSAPETYPLYWGPIRFHPTLGYHVLYGTGILREPSVPDTTVLQTFTPGLALELGRFWDLNFNTSINRYSNADFKNNIGYSLGLSGNIPLDKWVLSFGYAASMSEEPRIETGTQTAQQSHALTAGAVYNYSTRLSYDFGVSQDTQLTEQFANYWSWSTSDWINYHATLKTTLGFGVTAGYNLVDPGADSIFESLQGRFTWLAGERLSLQGSAGIQIQQFLTDEDSITNSAPPPPSVRVQDEVETSVFPIFALSATYQLFTHTSLTLGANQRIGNSALTGLFTQSTDVSFALRQRLLKQIYFDLRSSYSMQEYRSTSGPSSIEREDEITSIYVGLSTQLFKKLQTSIFYQYSDNTSTEDNFAFDSSQVGLQLNYRY
jgi:hypothetical protein